MDQNLNVRAKTTKQKKRRSISWIKQCFLTHDAKSTSNQRKINK